MKQVIVNLTEEEYEALREMAEGADLSFDALMKQALRVYNLVNVRQRDGYQMQWLDENGKPLPDMPVGCMGD